MMKGKFSASLLSLACASCATAGTSFDGQWVYRQECRFGHVATLELQQNGSEISGIWGDGTRVRGESGLLKGSIKGRRAQVWFCSESSDDADHTCPSYGNEDAHLERKGGTLIWYRGADAYLILHPGGAGKMVPIDDSDCAVEDD